MDSELEPVKLVQAEAVDNLTCLRFLRFGAPGRPCTLTMDPDVILDGIESSKSVGVFRAFFVEPGCVNYLVTLDYGCAERLMLENDQLALYVEYGVDGVDFSDGVCVVKSLSVRRTQLMRTPAGPFAQPYAALLPLRAAKLWRWV